MKENKISINLRNEIVDGDFVLYSLNNENECIICTQILKDSNKDLVLTNNYCKCYKNLEVCEQCFKYWIENNKDCIICRKKANNHYYSENKEIKENLIKYKDLEKGSEISDNTDYQLLNTNTILEDCSYCCYQNRYDICKISFVFLLGFLAIITMLNNENYLNNFNITKFNIN